MPTPAGETPPPQADITTGATDLPPAIAEGPATIDHADHYLADGSIVFPKLAQNSDSIASLFYELASVMSGVDPQTGQHMWRVYAVVDPKADLSIPCNPYPQACDVTGRPKALP